MVYVVATEHAHEAGRAAIPGGVPERPKGADCKSAGSAFLGSNPSAATDREKAPDLLRSRRGPFAVRGALNAGPSRSASFDHALSSVSGRCVDGIRALICVHGRGVVSDGR